eukprot:COSAG05_NODE_2379_length_3154_cov_3.363993_3_plen_96_part_00
MLLDPRTFLAMSEEGDGCQLTDDQRSRALHLFEEEVALYEAQRPNEQGSQEQQGEEVTQPPVARATVVDDDKDSGTMIASDSSTMICDGCLIVRR